MRLGGLPSASTCRPCTALSRHPGRCCWHARRRSAPACEELPRAGSAPAEQASAMRPAPWTSDASGRAPASPLALVRPACVPPRRWCASPLSLPSFRLSCRPSSRPWPRWRSASPLSCPRHRDRCRHRVRSWWSSCRPCTPWPPPDRARVARTMGSQPGLPESDAALKSPRNRWDCESVSPWVGRAGHPPASKAMLPT